MSLLQALFLSVLQGLTEFLPVSSSGHLVIAQSFLGLDEPPVAFDVLVHGGTLLAVIFYFRSQLIQLTRKLWVGEEGAIRTAWLLTIGTIPAALAGLALSPYLSRIFASLTLVGFALLATGLLLLSLRLVRSGGKEIKDFSSADAFLIGLFQAAALIPGISRAGATIVAAFWLGAKPKEAFAFSFFLAIPATVGALALQTPELTGEGSLTYNLTAFFVAAIVGIGALKVVEKTLLSARLSLFGFYCLVVGALLLLTGG